MPSFSKLALVALLTTLAVDARPTSQHQKKSCPRPATVVSTVTVGGTSLVANQAIAVSTGTASSAAYGHQYRGGNHRTRTWTRAGASSPTTVAAASTEIASSQAATSTESEAPLETFPTFSEESTVSAGVPTQASSSLYLIPVSSEAAVPSSSQTTEQEESSIALPTSTAQSSIAATSIIASSSGAIVTSAAAPSSKSTVAVFSKTAPVSTSAAAAPTSASGGKAGLAVNSQSGSAWDSWTGGDVSWLYNWGSTPPAGLPSSIEYVPQLWGSDSAGFVSNLAKFPSWNVKNILSFNEPDMSLDAGGSSFDPAKAADVHKAVFTEEVAGKYRIGAPAVARGGKGWLSDWVDACAGDCAYDFIPIHFYGDDKTQFAPYLKEMASFGKPLWVTEVACIEFGATTHVCNEAEATDFMKQVISDMNDPANNVERYSWFGAFLDTASSGNANGIMTTDGKPNALGKVYLNGA